MGDPPSSVGDEVLYVSWGGTGRAATVREALTRAGSSGQGLAYLAILDDGAFGDIEPAMLTLAGHELTWLLDAQIDLTRRQTNLDDVPVRVVVQSGDVVDRVVEEVEAGHISLVLIGAPVALGAGGAVGELVERLGQSVTVPVEIIEPAPPPPDRAGHGRGAGDRRRSGPAGDRSPQ